MAGDLSGVEPRSLRMGLHDRRHGARTKAIRPDVAMTVDGDGDGD